MKMQNADSEIQHISRSISDFSLMLKQVGRTMQDGSVVATPLAIETVFDIKDQSERIFREIKGMTELDQIKDEQGHLKEIDIGQKIVWCFKKDKVPYLLGQLDYLKLNLAIMLQILQLARDIAPAKFVPQASFITIILLTSLPRPRPTERFMMQERAEIQNMIVLQHWSFEELKSLYQAAHSDTSRRESLNSLPEEPPPGYDAPASEVIRLAVTGPPPRPPKEELAQNGNGNGNLSLVHYQEQPLAQLDQSLHQALHKENQVLSAQVPDIVNHLLHEWTLPQYPDHKMHSDSRASTARNTDGKDKKYHTHLSDQEEDTTESEYTDSDASHPRGYYIEGAGPERNRVKKGVRFRDQQAKVEDDVDEGERRHRRSSHRHIINSDEDSTDSERSSSPVATHRPALSRGHRRDGTASNGNGSYAHGSYSSYDRNRRPYTGGPSAPRNSPPEKEAVRPGSSRGMPSAMHNQPWQNQAQQPHPQSPALRPPPPGHYNSGPPQARMPPGLGGQYMPPMSSQHQAPLPYSPGASPVMSHGRYFPQQHSHQPRRDRDHKPRRGHSSRQGSDKAEKDKRAASSNIKKGIGIGAAAAGLMELLSGLDGI